MTLLGGYKISALEIERCLLSFNGIVEAAVIGLPDDDWGQLITAILVTQDTVQEQQLKEYLTKELAKYKHPRKFLFVSSIPRNAMGKVNKKELLKWVQQQTQ